MHAIRGEQEVSDADYMADRIVGEPAIAAKFIEFLESYCPGIVNAPRAPRQ